MDEVIFGEFKGNRQSGTCPRPQGRPSKRTFPAMDITRSGTRKEELLVPPDQLKKMHAAPHPQPDGHHGCDGCRLLWQQMIATRLVLRSRLLKTGQRSRPHFKCARDLEDAAGVALQAQMAREGPHRRQQMIATRLYCGSRLLKTANAAVHTSMQRRPPRIT